MKRLALSLVCMALLGACETTGAVRPPPVGPTVLDIEPGRARVIFRGVSRATEAEVSDRALLQAADLALMRGYDWFRVNQRVVDIAPPTTPRFTFGIGGASFGRHSAVGVGGSTGVGGEGTYVVSLEVQFGRAPSPPGPEIYDARAVSQTIRARLPR
jgi:hypothetical protein